MPCRYGAHSGSECDIQRTMLGLLNQLDGFDSRGDIKVILTTNGVESLDPAFLYAGRIYWNIEFPLPDIKTRRRIFQAHNVYLEEFVSTKDEISEGRHQNRMPRSWLARFKRALPHAGKLDVTNTDFKKAKEKVMFKKKEGIPEGLYM
ncbi:hypothetical protein MLD38_025152 [Melastoma candidum]|uniref:Uncharacterized protein n=1 Tax=Melastoma candidum TaxID=119954 RepID=A0ACB9NUK5_9MYRT|nr:hypothetical protein MLD38_025152 [Melastoma candidum]